MRKAGNTSNKHRYTKKCIGAILLAITTVLSILIFDSLETQAAETEWNFGYTSGVQSWTVPYDGLYKIETYGAKGGDYGSNPGGKGGKVVSTFTLKKNDVITIYNGGSGNQYAGGWGNISGAGPGDSGSGGGGSSEVYVTRGGNTYCLQVAGGGGGANRDFNGGDGGTLVTGSGNSGGGGGGYQKGQNGKLINADVPFLYFDPPRNPDGTYVYPGYSIWQPGARDSRNWKISTSRTGGYTRYHNVGDVYTEYWNDLTAYSQYVNGGSIEMFSGYFDVEGSVAIRYSAHIDCADKYRDENDYHDLRPDWDPLDIDGSYFKLVDQNNNTLEFISVRDVINGRQGTSLGYHNNETNGVQSWSYIHDDYFVDKGFILPAGTTKVGLYVVMKYNNWVLDGQNLLNTGIQIDGFYGSWNGHPSSGGSNYISTVFSAKDTSSESGINNGNGYTKITALHTHSYTAQITTAATCTAKGIKTYTCSCGDSYTEEIPALGHAWPTDYSYTSNNGIANGLAYKNCARCGTRLDSKWLNRIRVRYQNADGTYGSYTNAVSDYYYSGNAISWSRAADATYKYAGTSWTSTTAAKSVDITVYRNSYTVTLNKGTGISAVSGAGSKLYGSSVTIDATVKPGYTFKNWTGTFTTTIRNYAFIMPAKTVSLTANATPNTNTPYRVNHWVQKVTATSTEHNSTQYELVDTDSFTGTTDTTVTPSTKPLIGKYEGCIAPPLQTKIINGDGSMVIDYYYDRTKMSLDIDGEYLGQIYYVTAEICKFDVYINGTKVADDVTDYKNAYSAPSGI